MATSVTNWVWNHSRSVNAGRIVLLAIAHESDRDGIAEMSVSELVRKCRLGERTVRMAVRDLEQAGDLQVTRKGAQHAPNGYQVLMLRGADIAPLRGADIAGLDLRGADTAGLAPKARGADIAGLKPDTPQVKATHTNVRGAESAPLAIDPHVFTTTGTSEAEVKDVSEVTARDDVQRVCAHLADRIEANGSKRPAITDRWRQSARLMLDKDGRTETQLMTAIDWCQDHEFWRANILSMPKLREKYEQLRLQASRNGHAPAASKQAEATARAARQMARAQAREEASDPNRNGRADHVYPRALPAAGHG